MSRPGFERLGPPPRVVPLGLRLQALFGGALGASGWLVLAVLSPFAWLFAGNADVISPFVFRGGSETAEGRVTSVRETGASEGERSVYEVGYAFRAAGGRDLAGTSFLTGAQPEVGSSVRVEYLPQQPERSRIQGGRLSIFGPAALVSLVFPGIGAILAGLGLRSGRRRLRLLREGQLAAASFVGQAPTNLTVNERPVLELSFEYRSADGASHTFTQRTTDAQGLTDERREPILYLPDAPERATLVDALPKALNVDESGQIVGAASAVLAGLPPFLAALVNLALGAARFLR